MRAFELTVREKRDKRDKREKREKVVDIASDRHRR